ncbi:hypothetical protein [Aquimixticola soesokkakensis]|nr:hypothetical protein [Aquimixticola soesokkakensis]
MRGQVWAGLRIAALCGVAMGLFLAKSAHAQAHSPLGPQNPRLQAVAPAPSEEILLTLELAGEGAKNLSLTRADLLALPQTTFSTTTIWTEGRESFTGPTLADTLSLLGEVPQGAQIDMRAINDYQVTVDHDLLSAKFPIIALLRNGAPFSVRDLGPLWVVFPYDSEELYREGGAYSMSIWQLVGIRVSPARAPT